MATAKNEHTGDSIQTRGVSDKYRDNYDLIFGKKKKQHEALDELTAMSQELGMYDEPKCSDHPDAPHGFNRNASHTLDRYVCDCEGWEPDNV